VVFFAQLGSGENDNKVYHPHFKGNFMYQDNVHYLLQAQECVTSTGMYFMYQDNVHYLLQAQECVTSTGMYFMYQDNVHYLL